MAYDLTSAILGAESGGNPNARNPRSSAGGSGQFIDSTWLDMIKRKRPDLAAGKTDAQLLQLKFNPEVSREMTQGYADDNSAYLRKLGLEPTPGNVYLAHFAGPSGAAAILKDPGAAIEATLGPSAVAANPFLRGKTNAQVAEWAAGKVDPAKMMANSIRQRFGSRQQAATGPAAEDPPAAAGDGVNRLKQAIAGGYDADRLERGQAAMDRGQAIASTGGSPISAIGGALIAGAGGYMRGEEADARKAYQEELRGQLGQAGDPLETARLLMSSPDPKMQAAGLELYSQAQKTKSSNPESYGTTPQYYKDPQTGEIRLGQLSNRGDFKPANIPGEILPGLQFQDLGTSVGAIDKRTGETKVTLPKDVAGEAEQKAQGKETGEALGKGMAAIPKAETDMVRGLQQLDSVIRDPNLENVTGWEALFKTFRSKNRDTEEKIGQLQGGAFLQAFEGLKGGGSVTEAEGQPAMQALSRLKALDQSDDGFKAALGDYRREAWALYNLARRRGGLETVPEPKIGTYDEPGGAGMSGEGKNGKFKILKVTQ